MIDSPLRFQQPETAATEQAVPEISVSTLDDAHSTAEAAAAGEPAGPELTEPASENADDIRIEDAPTPQRSPSTVQATGELAIAQDDDTEAKNDIRTTDDHQEERPPEVIDTDNEQPEYLKHEATSQEDTEPSPVAEQRHPDASSTSVERNTPQAVEDDQPESPDPDNEDIPPRSNDVPPEAAKSPDGRPEEPAPEKPAVGGSGNSGTPELPVARGGDEGDPGYRRGRDLAPSLELFNEYPHTYPRAKELQLAIEAAESVAVADLEAGAAAVRGDDPSSEHTVIAPLPGMPFPDITFRGYHHGSNIDPVYNLARARTKLAQIQEARDEGRVIIGKAYSYDGHPEAPGTNYGIYHNDQVTPKGDMDYHAHEHPEAFDAEYRAALASFGHVMTPAENELFGMFIAHLTAEEVEDPLSDPAARAILEAFDETKDPGLHEVDRIEDDDLRERAFVTRGLMHIAHGGILATNALLLETTERSLQRGVVPFTPSDLVRLTRRVLRQYPEFKY